MKFCESPVSDVQEAEEDRKTSKSTGQLLRNFCCARFSNLLRALTANGQTHWRELLQKANPKHVTGKYLRIGHNERWSLYTVCTEAAEQVYRRYGRCSVNSMRLYMFTKHINMYLVFRAFASEPDSLLVSNTISMFYFIAISFAYIRSWCVPLSFKPLRFAHTFLMAYSISKIKGNVDKASIVSDYSKKCIR